MSEPLVQVRDLVVRYPERREARRAVDGIDLEIERGGSLGLVGESGSGKSTVAFALARYLPAGAVVTARRLRVAGEDVLELDAQRLRRYRRSRIGFVYQEPARALNPTLTVGGQVAETHRLRGLGWAAAGQATLAGLAQVGLADPAFLARRYPHELSGGQQQRVVIAMALAAQPELLILDEPTTGLDAHVEAEVLTLLDRLQRELGFAKLLISHNLPLVAAYSDRIAVLAGGRVVEAGAAAEVIARPRQEQTRALVSAVLPLDGMAATRPPVRTEPVLAIRGLGKRYGGHRVLDGVDLELRGGEVLGVVGESGSGKTTLGLAVAGLIRYQGSIDLRVPSAVAGPVQFVFQSPDASLNPRRTVRAVLERAIRLLDGDGDAQALAARVGLPAEVLDALPGQLSGGQKQRVAIARAFAGRAPIVVCDEATSALDVSVQAQILELLLELQQDTGVSLLFITHDLSVVRRIAHRIAVLRHGVLLELGETDAIFAGGRHPYTASLLAAARQVRSGSAAETRLATVGTASHDQGAVHV